MENSDQRIPLLEVRDLLRIGSALPFRVLDAGGRLLLNAGHVLADEAQFESLVERGAWAEGYEVEIERAARAGKTADKPSIPHALSLFDHWERLLWQLDKVLRALVRHQTDGKEVSRLFDALVKLIDVDPDVALFESIRHDDRRFALYPLTHVLNCAVIALLTGRHLGWSQAKVNSLGCAALTMNLAILELQATMAEQGEPPSTKQFKEIRAHPIAGAAVLRACGISDEEWLVNVEQHHEQGGGSGYPRELLEVHEAARLLRSIDVLMAKISPRARRPPVAPSLAVRQLFQQGSIDPINMALIKTLGVHPPGSIVQLHSGEVAVAIRRSTKGPHPVVATLSDKFGRPVPETVRRDTADPEFGIRGIPSNISNFSRVVPERVYGLIPVVLAG